jgi:predicted phosphodiesterase
MTKTRFIGDMHGLKYELALILDNLPDDITSVIQVGDMGVGFGQGDYWHESLDELMQSKNAKFIRGNHDSPEVCKTMKSWIPDGLIQNDMMMIGGAWSIDYQWRTMGLDLWEDEELSHTELNRLIDVYDLVRPRIMVTHDIPYSVATQLFFVEGRPLYGRGQYKTRTGLALATMFEIHKPDLWVFGHWHYDIDGIIDETRFICLNELSYCDVNMETLEVTWPEYQAKRMKP